MGKRVIVSGLSVSSLDKAIAKLEQYKQTLAYRTNLLQRRVAERVRELCQNGFDNALVDDILNGEPHAADVTVTVDDRQNVSVVVATGEDAIWVEFGAGVFYNGSVGSSPNPNGAKLGYTIGSYGKGHGRQNAWGFRDETGGLHITRGTPAEMPMYLAMRQIESEIYEIAREVFR